MTSDETESLNRKICVCKDGFYGDGLECKDIDECRRAINECHKHSTCKNTFGGYECICNKDMVGDGKNCVLPIRGNFENKTSYFHFESEYDGSCFNASRRCKRLGASLASFETLREWNMFHDAALPHTTYGGRCFGNA